MKVEIKKPLWSLAVIVLCGTVTWIIDYTIGVNLTNISATGQIIHKVGYMAAGVAIWKWA